MISFAGCEVDSFLFDSSKTGYFERQPTTIPILDRIDVIEEKEDYWARATPVSASSADSAASRGLGSARLRYLSTRHL